VRGDDAPSAQGRETVGKLLTDPKLADSVDRMVAVADESAVNLRNAAAVRIYINRRFGLQPRLRSVTYLRVADQVATGGRAISDSGTDFPASANATAAVDGFRLSTMELGMRIVAPRSFVVS